MDLKAPTFGNFIYPIWPIISKIPTMRYKLNELRRLRSKYWKNADWFVVDFPLDEESDDVEE